jgi:selenocysteine lyase/cysteine desulfurase
MLTWLPGNYKTLIEMILNHAKPSKLIVWNHASNVTGQISPVDLIVSIAKDKKF